MTRPRRPKVRMNIRLCMQALNIALMGATTMFCVVLSPRLWFSATISVLIIDVGDVDSYEDRHQYNLASVQFSLILYGSMKSPIKQRLILLWAFLLLQREQLLLYW